MSIFEALLTEAAGLLSVTEADLDQWRTQISEEAGKQDIHYIRERQLNSGTKSSTPLSQQVTRSEQVLTDLRDRLRPLLKQLLPQMLAYEIQNERVNRLRIEHELLRSKNLSDNSGQLHVDYIMHSKAMNRLGAGPAQVRQLAQHDTVIIADLTRWKAEDPRYEDPANPWLAVRDIYSNRTMYRHDDGSKSYHRSKPGAPPPNRHPQTGDSYWRFKPSSNMGIPSDCEPRGLRPEDSSTVELSSRPKGEQAKPVASLNGPAKEESQLVIGLTSQSPIIHVSDSTHGGEIKSEPEGPNVLVMPQWDCHDVAEQLYDSNPINLEIYWPRRDLVGIFDPNVLIPAIEEVDLAGKSLDSMKRFLVAVKDGNAENFIKAERHNMITYWARLLAEGNVKILDRARKANII